MSFPTIPDSPGSEKDRSDRRCPNCHAPLAPDQRFCLSCGQAVAAPRVEFRHALGLDPAASTPSRGTDPHPAGAAPPRSSGWDQRNALIVLAGIAAVVLALGVGIVIGRGARPAAPNVRVTVAGAPNAASTAAAATAAPAAVAATPQVTAPLPPDNWPAGASGWTVELSSLDKTGASAAAATAAKSAARAKGASAVGVLDGDKHAGTPTGKYVIYSGRFSSQAQAAAAQRKLAKSFPGALVLHVTPSSSSTNVASNSGTAQASHLQHLSGAAYSKASAKLPSTLGSGGAPPPKDNKTPGGGSGGGTCIGC
jgi:hypothetical protein